jgi:hypothetical protein
MALCIAITLTAVSQKSKETKIKFGDVKPEDFSKDYAALDSAADAVYLFDIGSANHEGNNSGWFSVFNKVHERIQLIHKKSFDDLATVKIYLNTDGTDKEKVENLQAATYNLEDGKVIQTKVEKSAIFQEKDGNYQVVKFTFPDLKEGSIIEYSYTTSSPFYHIIPTWTFQGDYPKFYSEFTIELPQFFDFVVLEQGYLTPLVDTVTVSSGVFNVLDPNGANASHVYSIKSNTVKHAWAFKDIPALKEEKFITTLSNYVQKLEFQFSAIRFPNEQPKLFLNDWFKTVEQLMEDEDFGKDLAKENGWLKDDVKVATGGETDAINKARKIYEYVRDNYTCTDYSAIYLSQSLKKTQQSKKGSVADINMLLIAMLKIANYTADPVLLSTRGHGKTYDIYPIMNKFNYLVVNLNISDKHYLLDASDPVLGFGNLSYNCYNGNARMIAALPSLIGLAADSLYESQVSSFFLTNDNDGKIIGSYKTTFGKVGSEMIRDEMKKSEADEYFKNIKKAYAFDIDMSNTVIDSLDKKEMPVSVQYNVAFDMKEDIIYFNPMMAADARKENPFKAAQRFYPVEMPYCMDETYILNMEVPVGYKVDELPKPARVTLNDNEGMFEYLIQQNGDLIQLRCRTKLNKATFEPEDYETLRNFFAFVVEKEGEQIVFKKI